MIIPLPVEAVREPGFYAIGAQPRLIAGPGATGATELLAGYLRTGAVVVPESRAAPEAGIVLRLAADQAAPLGDEGYELIIGESIVRLTAARPAGLLAGVQTLRQLLPPETVEPGCPPDAWRWPCLRVTDRPRLPWRGALLDVARFFAPLDYLYRFTDLLALHKLNVLHLHLTDDQGWRIEIDGWPRLTEVGAWRERSQLGFAGSGYYDDIPHGGYYTADQLRGLVRYAAARGVTIVPEIEMPGHARAALAAYPELGNHPDQRLTVWSEWGISEDTYGVGDDVLRFCRDVLAQTIDVFPSSFVHIGGDECPTAQWETSAEASRRVAQAGLAGPRQLRGWFLGQMSAFLEAHGRRPVCWGDAGLAAELPPSVAMAAWLDQADAAPMAKLGHPVIMAPAPWTFLDYPQSDDPREPLGQPGHSVTLRDVYDYEPLAGDLRASRDGGAGVLGVQAQLWTEYVSSTAHLSYLAFPRLCALADTAWSAADRDFPAFQRRLLPQLRRLELLGVPQVRPSGPGMGAAIGEVSCYDS
ncbi:MAG: beta-N-acetylhexosaminidase [Trebonia sp.]